ncbi:C4-dicarboxylate TRAP transporter substrate-binding protein [Halomonas sp. EGI 63088]|uniref:C4-dicarboxylate TRAP transporter substrate-binding protein n=1 Tax=Halomonas flagellata TaxID=2920385 RepID=A0ABS9RQR7_9GAMM|nr:C4-dicarboxylate TRAP transporter substrate-binding protein [Halomonas flagellata]MCH4562198.1 C4-dicarboxylate TRAP transporter substrate-binding protein [Halomonas flagellata]
MNLKLISPLALALPLALPLVLSGCGEESAQAMETINLRVGASHPESLPWVGAISDHFIPEVDRRIAELDLDYRINWQESYGGKLYKANATLSSVSQGIVDIGWVFSTLEGSRQPLTQVTAYTPGVTDDPAIMMDVFNELNRSVPALKAEWEGNNTVFLGATASDPFQIFTAFPLDSLDDLQGQKISAAGVLSSWLRGTGAVGVQGALPDFYMQVQTGVSNGSLVLPSGAFSIKLHEVAPYLTKVNLGSTYFGGLAINKDTFEGLPAEIQKILLEAGDVYSENVGTGAMGLYDEGMAAMEENPEVTILTWSDEQTREWIDTLPNLAKEWVEDNRAKGLPAGEVLQAYMDAMRKRGIEPMRAWDQEI